MLAGLGGTAGALTYDRRIENQTRAASHLAFTRAIA
jgi:hypothetical protein